MGSRGGRKRAGCLADSAPVAGGCNQYFPILAEHEARKGTDAYVMGKRTPFKESLRHSAAGPGITDLGWRFHPIQQRTTNNEQRTTQRRKRRVGLMTMATPACPPARLSALPYLALLCLALPCFAIMYCALLLRLIQIKHNLTGDSAHL